jgi:hypothetical protein
MVPDQLADVFNLAHQPGGDKPRLLKVPEGNRGE